MSAFIEARGLDSLKQYFDRLPDVAEQAAVYAINDAAEREGLAMVKQDMRGQVNFPAGYLEQNDRLKVSRKAYKGRLEAAIKGRDRATSLARFTKGSGASLRNGKLVVQVKGRSGPRTLSRAFLMKLRNGNTGLAIRLPRGQTPENTTGAVEIKSAVSKNSALWLLYGPSVDQVFRGVAAGRVDDIGKIVTRNFLRQFARLSNG